MKKRCWRRRIVTPAVFAVTGLVLSGGCAPVEVSELESFVRDLLLNTISALLL